MRSFPGVCHPPVALVPPIFTRSQFRLDSVPSLRPSVSFVLITGGARSGKSRFAVELAQGFHRRILYVATGKISDPEMRQRILRHRRQRPPHWQTIEPPCDPAGVLLHLDHRVGGVLMDCLTLYLSDLLMQGDSDAMIQRKLRRLLSAIRRVSVPVIMVTNEVGSGLVPEHPLGRRFRDLAGMANQQAAQVADCVVWMVSGIPVALKSEAPSFKER